MLQLRQLINSVVQRLREQEANEAQPPAQDLATPRQGLPRLLSDEDERVAARDGADRDMWSVMHDEDGRRERLFRLENASSAFRQQCRAPTAGAHIGFQLAQRSTSRVSCCGSCGAPTAEPAYHKPTLDVAPLHSRACCRRAFACSQIPLTPPLLHPRLCPPACGKNLLFFAASRLCAACSGMWLVRPQDLLSEAEQAVDMSLDDSEFTICCESADVVERHSYDVTADGVWCYAVGGLRCRGCDAFLGALCPRVPSPLSSTHPRSC